LFEKPYISLINKKKGLIYYQEKIP